MLLAKRMLWRALRAAAFAAALTAPPVAAEDSAPVSRYSLSARYTLESTLEQTGTHLPVQTEYLSGRVRTGIHTPWGEFIQSGVSLYDSTARSTRAWRDEAYWFLPLQSADLAVRAGDFRAGSGLDWIRAYDVTGVQLRRSENVQAVDTVQALLPDPARLHNVDPMTWSWDTLPEVPAPNIRQLAPGANEFSLQAGFLRLDRESPATFYADTPMWSAGLRYGVTGGLTLEGYAEQTEHMSNRGAGLLHSLGRYGTLGVSTSLSDHADLQGHQWMATYSGRIGKLRYFAGTQHRTPGYYDLQRSVRDHHAGRSDAPYRHLHTLGMGVELPESRQLRMNFVRLSAPDSAPSLSVFNISHAAALGEHAWWYTSAYASADAREDYGVYVGLRIRLGGGMVARYGASGQPTSTLRRAATTAFSGQGRFDVGHGVRLENRLSQSYSAARE